MFTISKSNTIHAAVSGLWITTLQMALEWCCQKIGNYVITHLVSVFMRHRPCTTPRSRILRGSYAYSANLIIQNRVEREPTRYTGIYSSPISLMFILNPKLCTFDAFELQSHMKLHRPASMSKSLLHMSSKPTPRLSLSVGHAPSCRATNVPAA